MSAGLTQFTDATTVTAASVRSRLDETQDYLNGGIISTDLRSNTTWVKASMIEKPKFFTSGEASRAIGATRDVYWQNTGADLSKAHLLTEDLRSDDWAIVNGCSRRVYVNPARYGTTANILVRCVYSAYDEGSVTSGTGNIDENEAAVFALSLDGTIKASTRRSIYSAVTGSEWKAARKTHVFAKWLFDVAAGEHDVSLKMYVNDNGSTVARVWNHIWVRSRMFRVDVQYL